MLHVVIMGSAHNRLLSPDAIGLRTVLSGASPVGQFMPFLTCEASAPKPTPDTYV